MNSASAFGLVLVLAAAQLLAGCGGGEGHGLLEVTPGVLDFGDLDPAGGSQALEILVTNVGDGPARVVRTAVSTEDGACGTFELDAAPPRQALGRGESTAIPVRFDPDPDVAPGCDCHALGYLDLMLDAAPHRLRLPLVVRGDCDAALRCLPNGIEFPAAIIEYVYEEQVQCYNLDPETAVTVEQLSIDGDDAGVFQIHDPSPDLPAVLELGESVSFELHYLPLEEAEHGGEIRLALAGGEELRLALAGSAGRERPLCVQGWPADPAPQLEGEGYTIVLEAEPNLSSYVGVVRSRWFYGDLPPLIADVLVTSGPKADPACNVGQSGHQAHWEGAACLPKDEGLFINVHAVPHSETVDAWVRSLEVWDRVTVRGYEVARINFDSGGYWQDAGCHTMVVTWVCDDEE